jgi:hypothetical protein
MAKRKRQGRGKKWYKERIKILKRLKQDDSQLLQRLRKNVEMHNEKIKQFRKKIREMG